MTTVNDMIDLLNAILRHECRHFNYYLQSLLTITGPERLWLSPLLEKEMMGELGHIRAFGDKVAALGGRPTTAAAGYESYSRAKDILWNAMQMENEVLDMYHDAYPKAQEYGAAEGDMSVVLLLEANIEDTTRDVEELAKIWREVG